MNRPPFETFTKPICKGSLALGTGCGNCESCTWEAAQPHIIPVPTTAHNIIHPVYITGCHDCYAWQVSNGGHSISNPEDAMRDAAGLCESEANRWSHDDKTAGHWRGVAVQLRAQYLTMQVIRLRNESAERDK